MKYILCDLTDKWSNKETELCVSDLPHTLLKSCFLTISCKEEAEVEGRRAESLTILQTFASLLRKVAAAEGSGMYVCMWVCMYVCVCVRRF